MTRAAATVSSQPVPTPGWSQRRLFLILTVALALRLYIALRYPVDYNAYWHVFIARNLTREYAGLAHPPLYLLLLKAADAVSHSSLAYQLVALLAGLGVVALTRTILLRLRASAAAADLAALTMAVAQPAVLLSCGVQSYMLAAVFIFWSFLPYLDLVRPEPATSWRSRMAFAVLVCLGVLTEAYTAFYLLACVAAPVLVAIFRPAYRTAFVRALRRRLAPDAATLVPPVVVGASIYVLIAKPWVRKFNTLPQFYFRPGQESVADFLTRNLSNLFNMFSPFTLGSPRRAAVLVLGFAVLVFLLAVRDRPREAAEADRAMPAAILIALLVIGMGMGLRGPYPFGGLMRQQFHLFLFAVPSGFVAFDVVLRRIRSARARAALIAAVVLFLAANLGWHARDFRNAAPKDFESQARIFHRSFPDATRIQVDQLNLIGFFMAHDDWNWRFAGRAPENPAIERYELEKDGKRLTLFAHRNRWNFDFSDPTLYPALRSALGPGDPDCFTVFCVHTNLYKPPERRLPDLDSTQVTAQITALAPPAGLEPGKIVFEGNDVYARFCRTPASR